MAQPIEFWFDLSSPFGYLAACRIDEIAEKHGRTVDWRPYMMGAVFQDEGNQPLTLYPRKGRYSVLDMAVSVQIFWRNELQRFYQGVSYCKCSCNKNPSS